MLFESQGRSSRQKAVDLEDIRFHQCVRLARFDNDRTISFIPPDGAFDLMSYRLSQNIKCARGGGGGMGRAGEEEWQDRTAGTGQAGGVAGQHTRCWLETLLRAPALCARGRCAEVPTLGARPLFYPPPFLPPHAPPPGTPQAAHLGRVPGGAAQPQPHRLHRQGAQVTRDGPRVTG